jgi:C-terminal processing protease CtpA/Prc
MKKKEMLEKGAEGIVVDLTNRGGYQNSSV